MTSIGDRFNEVTLETPSAPVADGDGQFTETWTELDPATWPVKIESPAATDMKRAIVGTVQATDQLIVTGPFHPGITTKTRMTWTDAGGRIHTANVKAVTNPDGRCLETVVACVEVVS